MAIGLFLQSPPLAGFFSLFLCYVFVVRFCFFGAAEKNLLEKGEEWVKDALVEPGCRGGRGEGERNKLVREKESAEQPAPHAAAAPVPIQALPCTPPRKLFCFACLIAFY